MHIHKLLPCLAAVLLAACSVFQPTQPGANPQAALTLPPNLAPQQTSEVSLPVVAVPPQPLPVTIAATATQRPSDIPMPMLPTDLPAASGGDPLMVKIFLVAVGDNGQSGQAVGCGDSLVAVQVQIPHTQGVLKAALEVLLGIKEQSYGQSGLYDALYQSDLQLQSVTIDSGTASIQLSGALKLGGECDDPRVLGQLKSTALQFATVSKVAILLNGQPLEEVLSGKGK